MSVKYFNSVDIKNIIFNSIIFFYIFFYIAGPALINIYLVFLGIFALAQNLKNKIIFDTTDYLLIVFFCYIFFKDIIFLKFDGHLLILFNFINIFIFFKNSLVKYNLKLFLFPISILTLILSIDGLYQYFNGSNIIGIPRFENYRLTSFFNDEPIIGSFLFKFFIPLFYFSFLFKSKLYLISISLLIFLTITLSGERLALIQSLLAFIVVICLNLNKYNYKKILLLVVSISTLIFFSLDSKLKDRLFHTSNEFVLLAKNFIGNENNNLGSLNNYLYNYKSGLEIWKHNPVFGGGYRFYNKNCFDILQNENLSKGCSTHPHNIYIETLSDHGTIGLIILSLLFSNFFINNYKKKNGFNLVFFLILIPFFPSQSIYSSYYQSIFLFILCLSSLKLDDIKYK